MGLSPVTTLIWLRNGVGPLPPPCTHIPEVIPVGKLSLRSRTPIVNCLTDQCMCLTKCHSSVAGTEAATALCGYQGHTILQSM